jgi:thiol-disulfide isomerase/thioredoxin
VIPLSAPRPPVLRALCRALLTLALLVPGAALAAAEARAAPGFTSTEPGQWLNSPPLDWRRLRGKVVLIEFWTFACSNCIGSIPWLRGLAGKFGSDLVIVGVHTPEFPHEAERENVVRKLVELGVSYPVMLDSDYRYWKLLGNRWWPAFYLVDRRGRIRARHIGETHDGDPRARTIETGLRQLANEPP